MRGFEALVEGTIDIPSIQDYNPSAMAEERHTFSRDERLKLSRDFRRCMRSGGRATGRYIIVYAVSNNHGLTRLGAGSTRRIGKAAVRNRQKRLVREAFRLTKHELTTGVDLVVLPLAPWRDPTLAELEADLVDTAKRAVTALGMR